MKEAAAMCYRLVVREETGAPRIVRGRLAPGFEFHFGSNLRVDTNVGSPSI